MTQHPTPYQSQFYAWLLTRRAASGSVESLASTLMDAQVDINPHQVDAALFACNNPLSRGVILADEVGLGKTIEAGLVISQRWAERRRRILIIVPANLRKQWHQELQDKFCLRGLILEAKSYKTKRGDANPFDTTSGPVICSYQFAKTKADDIQRLEWDLVVMDEAHRMRNVFKPSNVIARTLRDALSRARTKILLTATPLQNSLLELYGLVSMIDPRIFGELDSFRAQFGQPNKASMFKGLQARIAPIFKRTLRKDVLQYVRFTSRRALVEEFTPSSEEKELSGLVADYLRRPNLKALPSSQRQLISLVLWKLLASSTHAIAGALETMANRLQGVLDEPVDVFDAASMSELAADLDEDYESFAETADEWTEREASAELASVVERDAVAEEIVELRHFKKLASNISDNAKGRALLRALGRAFDELARLGAARKAIIFTESRRTQDYLLTLLADTEYGKDIVLFNGTNNDARARDIHKAWLARHAGTDKVTGSKSADTRAALVEHFRDHGTLMIATEAGAEGINLQFCSLVINFDLPWNPQRIEQRIGRCHRYGQKSDVVVLNFIDRSNVADKRVYELLDEKFQLFQGMFGASDEVLGAIGSGVDIEQRIVEIYQTCLDPEAINAKFEQLRRDLSGEIKEQMVKTRQLLLDHFDEDVQAKLRVRDIECMAALQRNEQLLIDLTKAEVADCAKFDDAGFELTCLPHAALEGVALGRYSLPRHVGGAHLYRARHPLAEWVIRHAKARRLPDARLAFDYGACSKQPSSLKAYRGQRGLLTVKLLSVEALGQTEQQLLVVAATVGGVVLVDDSAEKLLLLPARVVEADAKLDGCCAGLAAVVVSRKQALLKGFASRNMGWFAEETEKLNGLAADSNVGLVEEIKEVDRDIREIRQTAALAASKDQKLYWQKMQRQQEAKRNQLRRVLLTRQDEAVVRRDDAIMQLEALLQQKVEEETLFTIAWELL